MTDPGPLTLRLPWPPSLNNLRSALVIKGQPRLVTSADGRAYHRVVKGILRTLACSHFGHARLAVDMVMHPPTAAACDMDNFRKALLDALADEREPAKDAKAQHRPREVLTRGLWCDDSQIDHDCADRGAVVKGGLVVLTVRVLAHVEAPAADLFPVMHMQRPARPKRPPKPAEVAKQVRREPVLKRGQEPF